jgi:D-Tyr-tRNAtyr deacylase
MLDTSGKILTQIVHNGLLVLVSIDENMNEGEIQILAGKFIKLEPNRFIMTGIGFDGIFLF